MMKIESYLSFLIFIGKQFDLFSPLQVSQEVLLAEALCDAMQYCGRGVVTQMQPFFKQYHQ